MQRTENNSLHRSRASEAAWPASSRIVSCRWQAGARTSLVSCTWPLTGSPPHAGRTSRSPMEPRGFLAKQALCLQNLENLDNKTLQNLYDEHQSTHKASPSCFEYTSDRCEKEEAAPHRRSFVATSSSHSKAESGVGRVTDKRNTRVSSSQRISIATESHVHCPGEKEKWQGSSGKAVTDSREHRERFREPRLREFLTPASLSSSPRLRRSYSVMRVVGRHHLQHQVRHKTQDIARVRTRAIRAIYSSVPVLEKIL